MTTAWIMTALQYEYDKESQYQDDIVLFNGHQGASANIHKQKKHIGLSGMGNFLDVHYRNENEED